MILNSRKDTAARKPLKQGLTDSAEGREARLHCSMSTLFHGTGPGIPRFRVEERQVRACTLQVRNVMQYAAGV